MQQGYAYRIAQWNERYEVCENGKAVTGPTPIERLRAGKLPYIRWRGGGHALNNGWRKLCRLTKGRGQMLEAAVMGAFGKLLEIAGDDERNWRGWILDADRRPVAAEGIIEVLGMEDRWTAEEMETVLQILCHEELKWLEHVPFCPENAPNSPKIGDGGGQKGTAGEPCGGQKGTAGEPCGGQKGTAGEPSESNRSRKTEEDSSRNARGVDHERDERNKKNNSGEGKADAQARTRIALVLKVGPRQAKDLEAVNRAVLSASQAGPLEVQKVWVEARAAAGARKPIAAFVAKMQEMGYLPRKERV